MARGFRYYGKKRGHRRTGSPAWGSVGEAVFFAVLLLLGCGGTVLVLSDVWSCPSGASITSSSRPPARCSTNGSARSTGEDGPLYRPEIEIEYEVGGNDTIAIGTTTSIGAYSSGRRERTGRARPPSRSTRPTAIRAIPAGTIRSNPDVVVLVRGLPLVGLAGVHRAGFVRDHRRGRPDLHAAALGKVGGAPRRDGPAHRKSAISSAATATPSASIPSSRKAPTSPTAPARG